VLELLRSLRARLTILCVFTYTNPCSTWAWKASVTRPPPRCRAWWCRSSRWRRPRALFTDRHRPKGLDLVLLVAPNRQLPAMPDAAASPRFTYLVQCHRGLRACAATRRGAWAGLVSQLKAWGPHRWPVGLDLRPEKNQALAKVRQWGLMGRSFGSALVKRKWQHKRCLAK